jgi:isopenicillin N synthase-like dioxygenase
MSLPIVDFEKVASGHGLDDLDRAFRNWGFAEIQNHGVSSVLCEAMLGEMEWFFSLATQRKRAILRTEENHWGFYDRELTKNVRDWKEIFDVGPRRAACQPQWPEGSTSFSDTTMRFYEACEKIALQLVSCMGTLLGAEKGELENGFSDHTSYLRLNYYPLYEDPTPADVQTGEVRGALGISHHSDAGAVTVLLQDGVDGLQVEHGGRWHSVSARRGSLIVNIGDVVQVWSNDRYQAPLHRVLANRDRVRYSAPFFFNPGFETDYAPVAGACGEAGPLYRSINWGEFRRGRAAGDYADEGEEVQIAHYRIETPFHCGE